MPTAPSAFPLLGAPQAPSDEPNLPEGSKSLGGWPPEAEGIPQAPRHTRPDPCLDNTAGQSATQHLERSSPKSICRQNDLDRGWSSQPKPDEVKMVLYIVEECEMPCFSLAVTEWQMSIRTAEVRLYCFFFFCFFSLCFGRGTSVVRRDQGGGLALLESCQSFCRSRYDAYNPKSAMKTVHHWRPTLMHLGCMIEFVVWFKISLCQRWKWSIQDSNLNS